MFTEGGSNGLDGAPLSRFTARLYRFTLLLDRLHHYCIVCIVIAPLPSCLGYCTAYTVTVPSIPPLHRLHSYCIVAESFPMLWVIAPSVPLLYHLYRLQRYCIVTEWFVSPVRRLHHHCTGVQARVTPPLLGCHSQGPGSLRPRVEEVGSVPAASAVIQCSAGSEPDGLPSGRRSLKVDRKGINLASEMYGRQLWAQGRRMLIV